MRKIVGGIWMCIALVGATSAPAGATMVQRLTLDRITRAAARVVHATVTDVRSGRDESGLPATWVTLSVAQTLKGPASNNLTIKQFGVAEPLADGTITRIAGLPRYTVGDEIVLFLHGDSRAGFTSPVGLGQGCYRVRRGAARAVVRDDLGSRTRDLDEFLSSVHALTAAAE